MILVEMIIDYEKTYMQTLFGKIRHAFYKACRILYERNCYID